DSAGRAASRAASTRRRRSSIPVEASRAIRGAPPPTGSLLPASEGRLARPALGVEHEVAARVLEQQLDLALRLLQLGVAQAAQPHALLVEDERLLQRQLALPELLHDLVVLEEGGLEGG